MVDVALEVHWVAGVVVRVAALEEAIEEVAAVDAMAVEMEAGAEVLVESEEATAEAAVGVAKQRSYRNSLGREPKSTRNGCNSQTHRPRTQCCHTGCSRRQQGRPLRRDRCRCRPRRPQSRRSESQCCD